MPEKTQSVQVDAAAHARVQQAAKVLGSTQQMAASLLIEVADMGVVLRRHQEGMAERFKTEIGQQPGPGNHRPPGHSASE